MAELWKIPIQASLEDKNKSLIFIKKEWSEKKQYSFTFLRSAKDLQFEQNSLVIKTKAKSTQDEHDHFIPSIESVSL